MRAMNFVTGPERRTAMCHMNLVTGSERWAAMRPMNLATGPSAEPSCVS